MYKPAEVARMLNIPITRLETWVRENRVPHLRAGVLRGVEFTTEDIRQISRMLPELMGGRRGGQRTGTPGGPQTGTVFGAPARREPSAQKLAEWAQLTAHRPTHRRSPRSR